MPVTVIVGGQFGGEGKGKVAHFLAQDMNAEVAVRVGGTNSGHTVIDHLGNALILRQLPTPSILPDVTCVLGAGSYIDVDILFSEIAKTGLKANRLLIDPNAVIISENEINAERNSTLRNSIGSTQSGTGAAVMRRISRDGSVKLAKDDERLKQFIQPVVPYMREQLSNGERVIVEGTQGFGLSLLHSPYYPYTTSRDTTAAAFISEAGLSPLDVDDIVLVIRAFPIRVGGNSGPLLNELDWCTVAKNSNQKNILQELSSVTKTVRRVGEFEKNLILSALTVNHPTRIVLNHIDYLDPVASNNIISNKATEFISKVENDIERRIEYLGVNQKYIIMNKYTNYKQNKLYRIAKNGH